MGDKSPKTDNFLCIKTALLCVLGSRHLLTVKVNHFHSACSSRFSKFIQYLNALGRLIIWTGRNLKLKSKKHHTLNLVEASISDNEKWLFLRARSIFGRQGLEGAFANSKNSFKPRNIKTVEH